MTKIRRRRKNTGKSSDSIFMYWLLYCNNYMPPTSREANNIKTLMHHIITQEIKINVNPSPN